MPVVPSALVDCNLPGELSKTRDTGVVARDLNLVPPNNSINNNNNINKSNNLY